MLADKITADLLATWNLPNFAAGMHGQEGHDPEMLNWRIAAITDDKPGNIVVHLNTPAASTNQAAMALLARRVLTLNSYTHRDLKQVTVMSSDGTLTGVCKRSQLPKVPGLGTA